MVNTIISSFRDVEISKNSLVLCDIDETLLKFDEIPKNWWKEKIKENYKKYDDYEKADKCALEEWKKIINEKNPLHTDEEGLYNMFKKLDETKSTLIFITARNIELYNVTKKHFDYLGIDKKYRIYFLNGEPKGEFIEKNLNHYKYHKIIFIDDTDENLTDVYNCLNKYNKLISYKFI